MQAANITCLSVESSPYPSYNPGTWTGTASSVPQNLLALSMFMSSLKCKSKSREDTRNHQQVPRLAEEFQYMQEPLAKMTDHTESSERLVRFTEKEFLTKEVVKVGTNIHVAIGFALANSIMIEGNEGVIIIDTTESVDSMSEIMDEFRKITDKPVKAIILTHFHTDHILGTQAIIGREKKLRPSQHIDIIAHELIFQQMLGFASTYGIGYKRAHRQFGSRLPRNSRAMTGSGIGPFLRIGNNANFVIPLPTKTYKYHKSYEIAGLEFELIHTPGETDDQTTIWLPKERAVFPADNIYKAFPNIYAIRGSPSRDAKSWYASLDQTRKLEAEYLVGSHGQPVVGKEAVSNTLLAYRDAIKYVHDQTLRLVNKGYFPTQIAEMIKLPDALADHPYLQEHYGTVAWSIRGIYTKYLGWFSGDPKELYPMTQSAQLKKMTDLISDTLNGELREPVEILLQNAQESHVKSHNTYLNTGKHDLNEDKWALQLVDMLLESNSLKPNLVHAANQIKVSALRAIGSEQISANARNYYMTYAMEVESGQKHLLNPSDTRKHVIKTSPIKRVLEAVCSNVKGLQCQYDNYTVSYSFIDTNEVYTATLRNSVCDVYSSVIEPHQISLSTTTTIFKSIITGDADFEQQVSQDGITFLSGTGAQFKKFLSCFDRE